mgnify:FL=1
METNVYIELRNQLTLYLENKRLRKTEERYTILERICTFTGHFDICMLYDDLEKNHFHVSKATLYNTVNVLVDAGLVVCHCLMGSSAVQYELRLLAETHLHLICTKCGAVRELRNDALKAGWESVKISRFTSDFYCLYVYGICSKCKYKMQRSVK